jgi:SH3-like domain-containing protein
VRYLTGQTKNDPKNRANTGKMMRKMVVAAFTVYLIFSQQVLAQDDEGVRGAVTHLLLPRFVSLKTSEGNARRGPGTGHRVDWVFTRRDMPLRVTAEFEHWRRVEDAEGLGGWMHYALLSGVRTVLVAAPTTDLFAAPNSDSLIVAHLEHNVVAQIIQCAPEWCQLEVENVTGWTLKSALWGVEAGEILE